MFDLYWVELAPEDYIFETTTKTVNILGEINEEKVCALSIVGNKLDFFILGNNFMRGYYTIHVMETGTLGVVPNSLSKKEFVERGAKPTIVLAGSEP